MKTIAWLAILLISLVPLVLAVEGSADASANVDTSTSTESSANTAVTTSSQDNTAASGKLRPRKMALANMKERHEERKENREEMKEARYVVRDVRKLRNSTRVELKKTREEFRANLKVMKEDLKSCKGQASDECKQMRSEAKLSVKTQLGVAAEEALKFLESAKTRISDSKLENTADLIVEINARIEAINAAKVKVDALTEASSKEEIQLATKELRKAIQEARKGLQLKMHLVVANKLGNVLKNADSLVARLDKALAKLKEKGVDTSRVDSSIFKAKVEVAKGLHKEAVSLFEQAKAAESGKKDELMKQATAKLQDSQKALKEAHALLKKILQDLKALKGGDEALTSAVAETQISAEASS
ncbi:MAG: hypothetical protein AABX70_03655 [Nanoarchaeota archaeon]